MTTAGLLLLAILVMCLFPATPAAKWLHLHLVELPMAVAAKLERRHVIFILLMILFAQAAAAALPLADVAALGLWDLAAYVDAVAVASVVAVASRARWIVRAIAASLLRRPNAARARRTRPQRRELPANDDGVDERGRLLLTA